MPLVDPGGDRHQLDGIDADPLQMADNCGMGEGADRAAPGLGDIGIEDCERLDGDFVDQTAGREAGASRLAAMSAVTTAFGISAAVSSPKIPSRLW